MTKRVIIKTKHEMLSKGDRQEWAEQLILNLNSDSDSRNSWLLNFGRGAEAINLRAKHVNKPKWDSYHDAAEGA